jgi:threonine dehydratase
MEAMKHAFDLLHEIDEAERRIRPFIRETYLEYSPWLSQESGCEVFLKLENLQHTGSFKTRGAMNKVLSLEQEPKSRGVVAASTGNHGAAVAYCARILRISGTIFVPEQASPAKVEAMKVLGAEVQFHGTDCIHAEARARRYAASTGKVYISPYNDPQVVAGQGTIGVELGKQLDHPDALFVALGGGGLIGGVSAYMKARSGNLRVIGCSPENSCVMVESVKAGSILDLDSKPTLSDGTAGGVESGSITFDLCRQLIDEYVLVSEDEIRKSLKSFMEKHPYLIEGAAAVAVASFLKTSRNYRGRTVVLVICGANIAKSTLKELL